MIKRIIYILFISFQSIITPAQTTNRIGGQLIVQLFKEQDIDNTISRLNSENNFDLQVDYVLSKRLNIWLVNYDEKNLSGENIINTLVYQPEIANVQFNHTIQNRATPNDDSYPSQWNMFNDGTGGGIADADIDADEAWDITTGGLTANGDTIVIAVVDNGFDLNHEDLSFFKNDQEVPLNLIDDDGNGYIDDYDGWNSIDNNGIIPSFNHGTHVSGIAGAIGNNTIGVAGVNWDVKILPVVCEVTESQVITSYAYVFDVREQYNLTDGTKGAYIVVTNSSFGIDFASPDDYPVWCAMYDSLGQLGILSAAATNNSITNIDVVNDMPTGCSSDFLIAVTNTDRADNLKASYGAVSIDLGAPGTLIQSTFPDNTYGAQTGTSMASPHVAGAVALLFSAACEKFLNDYELDPQTKSLLLKDYILNGVDLIEDLNGVCVSNGRLNLYKSLQNLITGYCDLGIHGTENPSDNIAVFPNPADEKIYIDPYNWAGHEMNISIFNETMQLIRSNSFAEQADGIDVTNFLNGIYFLKLADIKSGVVFTSVFVVQH